MCFQLIVCSPNSIRFKLISIRNSMYISNLQSLYIPSVHIFHFDFLFYLKSIAQVASGKNFFLRFPINMAIRQTNSQPIVTVTAKEFMFGYESALTTLGNQFLPDWIFFDKVGLIDRVSITK